MSPSRIQTAAVILQKRRSQHLERKKAQFSCLIIRRFICRFAAAASQVQPPCCIHCTSLCGPLLPKHRLQGGFEVGRDGLLRRYSLSLPGYCMHNEQGAGPRRRRGLAGAGSHSGIPNLLMFTGLVAQSHYPQ